MKLFIFFKIFLFGTTILLAPSNCENEDFDVTEGLIAYYPFNGNALDESGHNNNGEIRGAVLVSDRNDKPESAYFFDGASEIAIPDTSFFNDLSSFCICAWAYPTELKTRDNTIISKVNPNRDFNLKIHKGLNQYVAHFAYDATYYRCYSQHEANLNTWTHLVLQWTGTKWQMYINGKMAGEADFSGITPPWTGSIMAIGSMNGSEFFTGKIDNIRIYNRTLTETEIGLIYLNAD